MIEKKERIGAFTSSNVYKLMTLAQNRKDFGKPALTYIEEKRIERRLGRSIDTGAYSKEIGWGNFMEMFVFSKINIEYLITSNTTDVHPTIKGWAGSKDLIVPGKKIGDIKCYFPKNFALYADALMTNDTEIIKKNFSKEYWQLVSNAIINNVPNAEAILYMPYQEDLEEIRKEAENYEGSDQWKYRFIYESPDAALPFLVKGGHYTDIVSFEFEVPEHDKELLETTVLRAIKNI